MQLRTPKYKNTAILTLLLFILIMLLEVIPGYYQLAETLYSVVVQKYSDDNHEKMESELIQLNENQNKLKRIFYGEFTTTSENSSFSNTLEKFNVKGNEFDISINSIKPLKKLKNGRLSFQRVNIAFISDYENSFNYCRWLEVKSPSLDFEELVISKQKNSENLQTNIVIDVLYSGGD